LYVEGLSVTMDGARMKQMLSAGLLDTAGGVPPQTQDLEMLLEEETLVWTMSNVRDTNKR